MTVSEHFWNVYKVFVERYTLNVLLLSSLTRPVFTMLSTKWELTFKSYGFIQQQRRQETIIKDFETLYRDNKFYV